MLLVNPVIFPVQITCPVIPFHPCPAGRTLIVFLNSGSQRIFNHGIGRAGRIIHRGDNARRGRACGRSWCALRSVPGWPPTSEATAGMPAALPPTRNHQGLGFTDTGQYQKINLFIVLHDIDGGPVKVRHFFKAQNLRQVLALLEIVAVFIGWPPVCKR